jgi:hypothetical protein
MHEFKSAEGFKEREGLEKITEITLEKAQPQTP